MTIHIAIFQDEIRGSDENSVPQIVAHNRATDDEFLKSFENGEVAGRWAAARKVYYIYHDIYYCIQ